MTEKINPWVIISLIVGLITGYYFGYYNGYDRVLYTDHIQASAGIFIDGYAKNKIYHLKND